MEYEAEIVVKIRVMGKSFEDAIATIEGVELSHGYVEDSFELLGIKTVEH